MIGRRTFLAILATIGFEGGRGISESIATAHDAPAHGGEREPDPALVLKEIREHVSKGEYAEALRKHIWYHENAVRLQPGHGGVRLSFALYDWVELGKKYPKAREALRAIRDDNHESLRQGKGTVREFHDLASIDSYLEEMPRTVETFRIIRAIDPKLATRCYDLAEEALVAQEFYDDCLEYLGDPQEKLRVIIAARTRLLTMDSVDEHIRRAADSNFTDNATRLITILARGGRSAKAESVREAALQVVDNDTLRSAGK